MRIQAGMQRQRPIVSGSPKRLVTKELPEADQRFGILALGETRRLLQTGFARTRCLMLRRLSLSDK